MQHIPVKIKLAAKLGCPKLAYGLPRELSYPAFQISKNSYISKNWHKIITELNTEENINTIRKFLPISFLKFATELTNKIPKIENKNAIQKFSEYISSP